MEICPVFGVAEGMVRSCRSGRIQVDYNRSGGCCIRERLCKLERRSVDDNHIVGISILQSPNACSTFTAIHESLPGSHPVYSTKINGIECGIYDLERSDRCSETMLRPPRFRRIESEGLSSARIGRIVCQLDACCVHDDHEIGLTVAQATDADSTTFAINYFLAGGESVGVTEIDRIVGDDC